MRTTLKSATEIRFSALPVPAGRYDKDYVLFGFAKWRTHQVPKIVVQPVVQDQPTHSFIPRTHPSHHFYQIKKKKQEKKFDRILFVTLVCFPLIVLKFFC